MNGSLYARPYKPLYSVINRGTQIPKSIKVFNFSSVEDVIVKNVTEINIRNGSVAYGLFIGHSLFQHTGEDGHGKNIILKQNSCLKYLKSNKIMKIILIEIFFTEASNSLFY